MAATPTEHSLRVTVPLFNTSLEDADQDLAQDLAQSVIDLGRGARRAGSATRTSRMRGSVPGAVATGTGRRWWPRWRRWWCSYRRFPCTFPLPAISCQRRVSARGVTSLSWSGR